MNVKAGLTVEKYSIIKVNKNVTTTYIFHSFKFTNSYIYRDNNLLLISTIHLIHEHDTIIIRDAIRLKYATQIIKFIEVTIEFSQQHYFSIYITLFARQQSCQPSLNQKPVQLSKKTKITSIQKISVHHG